MKIKIAIGVIVVAAVAVSLAGTADPQHPADSGIPNTTMSGWRSSQI